jgi:pyruvate dehydrogenase E2 component (dihydrolipoamide acetyltransferase)
VKRSLHRKDKPLAIEIVMPALEMAQETALLLKWLKKEGDFVSKGDVLMEIETDKATVEIEATGSGFLSRMSAQAGDQVPVGQVIAVLLEEPQQSSGSQAPPPPVDSPTNGQGTLKISGSKSLKVTKPREDVPGPHRISPKARRLARQHGVNLSSILASGQEHAVHASDISKMLEARSENEASTEYKAFPLQGKRRVIAERTQKSYQTAPHISLSLSINMSEAQRLIERTRPTGGDERSASPGLTCVFLKAAAEALLQHPRLNSHLVNDEVREYHRIDLGVAVAVEDGLVVPVIRDAGRKSVMEIQDELQDLVARARSNRLQLREMTGGTFTVSNLGMFGIENFSAILNPPEVGILSLGCIVEKAVNNQGRAEFRPFVEATINVDHRALDGAVAAKYLQRLKELLENPRFIN